MSTRWLALLGVAFWAVVLIQSVAWRYYWTRSTPNPVTLEFIARAELLMFGIAGLLTPLIVRSARWVSGRGWGWAATACVHVGGAIVFGSLVKLLWDVSMLPFYQTPWLARFSLEGMFSSLMAGLRVNAALYWVVVAGVSAIDASQRYRSAATEAAELRAQLAESQLATLRIQLDPHFLFNALNGIAGLVPVQPELAESMISDLSELLRRSLAQRDRQVIRLSEEVHFLQLYAGLQQRRYGKRLAVQYEVDGKAAGALVPGLLLQPLVENAIRHAIAPRREGGTVRVGAAVQAEMLELVVEDRVGAPTTPPDTEGVGLRITRERLSRMYGEAHSMEIRAGEEGLCVCIRIPLRYEQADAA